MIVKYTKEELEHTYPGSITNEKLLKDNKKYLRDEKADDPSNFIIKKKLREKVDYKILTEKSWFLL